MAVVIKLLLVRWLEVTEVVIKLLLVQWLEVTEGAMLLQ